jgi:hypothetical protein
MIMRDDKGGVMATTDQNGALAVIQSTSAPIHDIGTAIYLSPDVFGWAAEWGWSNPFAFYFAGRGGMLGDVGAQVVYSAFGWFEPSAVATFFDEGAAVEGAGGAALRMAEAHARWGRKYLSDVKGLADIVTATETLVDGLEGSGLPLFTGWRAAPRADDEAGRLAQLMQILREWRGGLHLVATTAVGLTPREAILTNEGEGQAKFFGWSEPFPDCADIRFKHDEAEALTDQRSVASFTRALDADRFEQFEAGVVAVHAALP